jgi:hypothetical protein
MQIRISVNSHPISNEIHMMGSSIFTEIKEPSKSSRLCRLSGTPR